MSAAQPLCGPRKVFYETTIWKRCITNLSFYRNTNQISSLPAKPITDKAHNTSCCLTKFLPKPVRCTVKSFLRYWYQIHKIHNAASSLCQSWSLVVAKGRRGGGWRVCWSDRVCGCSSRHQAFGVLLRGPAVAADECCTKKGEKRQQSADGMIWKHPGSGVWQWLWKLYFFFFFFLPTLVFCRLWKQNADVNPPRGEGLGRGGSLLQCLNRRWAVTNDNWHMPPFQWLIKGECGVTALHFFFFFKCASACVFFCSTSSCVSPCQSLFYDG